MEKKNVKFRFQGKDLCCKYTIRVKIPYRFLETVGIMKRVVTRETATPSPPYPLSFNSLPTSIVVTSTLYVQT